jgi:hypothetical protein
VEDLVLRQVLTRYDANKLSPGWESPLRVTQVYRPRCVRLATEDGEPLPNPWNIEYLRKFYPYYSSECLEAVLGRVMLRWDLLPLSPGVSHDLPV